MGAFNLYDNPNPVVVSVLNDELSNSEKYFSKNLINKLKSLT